MTPDDLHTVAHFALAGGVLVNALHCGYLNARLSHLLKAFRAEVWNLEPGKGYK